MTTQRSQLKRRKTPADYQALAKKRGFRWLGPEVRNVKTKTRWKCSLGHTWKTGYDSIQRGHGCPICARPSDRKRRSVTKRLPSRSLRTGRPHD